MKLDLLRGGEKVHELYFQGQLWLGRQRATEPAAFGLTKEQRSGKPKLVICDATANNVSREHLMLEVINDSTIRCHSHTGIEIPFAQPHHTLPAGGSELYKIPCQFHIGDRDDGLDFIVGPDDANDDIEMQSLVSRDITTSRDLRQSIANLSATTGGSSMSEDFRNWLQILDVLHASANSADFINNALDKIITFLGFDSARYLVYNPQTLWKEEQSHFKKSKKSTPARLSQRVLQQMLDKRQPIWSNPSTSSRGSSIGVMESVAAAPIVDKKGQIVGALYAERFQGFSHPVKELDVMFLASLANSVTHGFIHEQEQRAALEAHCKLEQFFTKPLAGKIAGDTSLLVGKEAEITALFCDVRNFSSIIQNWAPEKAVGWIQDVMTLLSECVLEEDGVVVDYVGDEVFAMWGAPEPQPDHAVRAVRAALRMFDRLRTLDVEYASEMPFATSIGIGVNSGLAYVGNVGSQQKFKYGPLGNVVNIASRVQGATKYLKTPLLLTGDSWLSVQDRFLCRRVCKVRVVNIDQPIDLYDVNTGDDHEQRKFFKQSEQALTHLETRQFGEAARLAGELVATRNDGPLLLTLSRAVEALIHGPEKFDSVWTLPGK